MFLNSKRSLGINTCLDIPVQYLAGEIFQTWSAKMPHQARRRTGSVVVSGLYLSSDLHRALEQSLPHFENDVCGTKNLFIGRSSKEESDQWEFDI